MIDHHRLIEIFDRLKRLAQRQEILLSRPRSADDIAGKKHNFLNLDDDAIRTKQVHQIRFTKDCAKADVIVLDNFGQASETHQYLQQQNYQGLFCLWMHDNHTGALDKVAAGCDMYFPCHFVNLDNMVNPHSLQGPVLIDYCRNIPLDQIRAFLESHPSDRPPKSSGGTIFHV